MKKFIAWLLVITTLFYTFASCGKDDTEYMIKGEFFNAFIKYMNYYPLNATVEDMENAENYDIEAQTMVDWDLLPEDIAKKGLEKPIRKEEAVLACLNAMYFKKTGNVEDIKDAKLCKFPQEMADAVANDIVSLQNNYIDGRDKMTEQEVDELLEATLKERTNNRFEEGEGEITFDDDSFVFDAADISDDVFYVEGYEEANAAANANSENLSEDTAGMSFFETPEVGDLVHDEDTTPVVSSTAAKEGQFSVFVSEDTYNLMFAKCEIGQTVVYTGLQAYSPDSKKFDLVNKPQFLPATAVQPFIGKLVEVIKAEPLPGAKRSVCLVLESLDDVDKAASTKVKGVSHQIKDINFEQLKTDVAGFKVDIKSKGTGLDITLEKTFKLSENKYFNWRDATKTIKATFNGSVDNIWLTLDKTENFFKKNGTGGFKVTCDIKEEFELESGGLRLAPDSNRNGKFWSNITKSRFTDGAGAKSVKVAKFRYTIPNTPVSGEIGVYLVIQIDGKITIALSQTGKGFEVVKEKNGQIRVSQLGDNKLDKAEVNVNLRVGLQILAQVDLLFVKDILSGSIEFGLQIAAMMGLYRVQDDGEEKLESSGCGDPEEALGAQRDDDKMKFCVDVSIAGYINVGLDKENLIGKAAGKFGYDLSKIKYDDTTDPYCLHFEDGSFVSKCTRGQKVNAEDAVEEDDDDKFTLSSTKVHLEQGLCTIVYVTDSPVSDKVIKKNKGIKVKSKNTKVAKVYYDKDSKAISIESVSPGSTEVEVYLQKNKKSKKQYTQTFSVTVLEDGTTEVSFVPSLMESFVVKSV